MSVQWSLMRFSMWLRRFAVALGGLLILIAILLIGVSALAFLGIVDFAVFERIFENESYRLLFLGVLLTIGVLDMVSGIILRRR